jgi:hypothetical protein
MVTQDYLDELNGEGLEVAADATPLDFLQAIYRNPKQPMSRRLRAATEAAQYVHPTFKAMAMVSGNDFAAILERRMKRAQANGLLELKALPSPGFRRRY